MAKIQILLEREETYNTIDYNRIVADHPWVIKPNQKCVLSPDSDGFLCGLFMSHFLNWEIVGYYDGKVLVIDKKYDVKDVIFLDIEVCRKEIRSIGHHMLLYNKKYYPNIISGFENCIQPNLIRKYDSKTFRLKYPLATIHLLIGILDNTYKKIKLDDSAICPLYFTDGTFNVLFSYPENVLQWLKYLKADDTNSALHFLFENDKYTINTLMKAMDEFFRERDKISIHKERGDRLRISLKSGAPHNLEPELEGYKINEQAKERITKFIKLISSLTKWDYKEQDWKWNNFIVKTFSKSDFTGDKKSLTNKNYEEFLLKQPLSWAMTSGQNIEYTLEAPDKML